jgi:hypothetical protein
MIIQKEQGLKILLIFLSIVLTLSALEISFRIIGKLKGIDFRLYMQELKNPDRLPKGIFIDTHSNYILRPDSQFLSTTSDFFVVYSINSRGIRDREYTIEKPENITRILVFGDSFTFGEGVEYGKRFTDIPEKHLPNIELINFGVPGYGLDDSFVFFINEGLKYNADYLFILINTASLMRQRIWPERSSDEGIAKGVKKLPLNYISTVYIGRDNLFFKKNKSLVDYSFFLSYIRFKLSLFMLQKRFQAYDKNLWDNILYNKNTQIKNEAISSTIQLLADANEICKANGIKLVVINICNLNAMGFLDHLNEDIKFVDLSNELIAESKNYPLTFKYDPHFNQKTHDFIGRRLIEIINSLQRSK